MIILVYRGKSHIETRENVYVMTMVSRNARQIVGFDITFDWSPQRIQNIVDCAMCGEILYSPILARRSICFAIKLETLRAVVEVFVDAYNRLGKAKYAYRQRRQKGVFPVALVDLL